MIDLIELESFNSFSCIQFYYKLMYWLPRHFCTIVGPVEMKYKLQTIIKFNRQQSNHIIRQYEVHESVDNDEILMSALCELVWLQIAMKIWKEEIFSVGSIYLLPKSKSISEINPRFVKFCHHWLSHYLIMSSVTLPGTEDSLDFFGWNFILFCSDQSCRYSMLI